MEQETRKERKLLNVLEKANGMMRRDHPDQAAEELKKAIDRIEALEEYQDGETGRCTPLWNLSRTCCTMNCSRCPRM